MQNSYLAAPEPSNQAARTGPIADIRSLIATVRGNVLERSPRSLEFLDGFEAWMLTKDLPLHTRQPLGWMELQLSCYPALATREIIERVNLYYQCVDNTMGLPWSSARIRLLRLWKGYCEHYAGMHPTQARVAAAVARIALVAFKFALGAAAFAAAATLSAFVAEMFFRL